KKVPWRGADIYFEVVTVHMDILMYRIENSRTSRQQQKYTNQLDLPKDFFKDPESKEVQNAQESILLKMAKSQKGFMDDLKARKQKDELIITRDGYIVNGNRRTAALKSQGETYFQCAVLPVDATAKDLYSLEQELQISTDFRMDYDWVNELNNIREGILNLKYGFREAELSKNLRITKQALRTKLKTIELVDQYLDWCGKKGNYDFENLDKAEQGFEELEKGLKKFAGDILKQNTFKNEVFVLLSVPPGSMEGRLYERIRSLVKNFDSVQEKLKPRVFENTNPTEPDDATSNDPITDIIGDTFFEAPFKTPENVKESSNWINDAIEDSKAESKDTEDGEAVFTSAKKALRELSGLVVDSTTLQRLQATETLEKIIETSRALIQELIKND
ncbi:MAG: hypothetical protein ACI9JN_000396, partial [Bacteroidia bacterium]